MISAKRPAGKIAGDPIPGGEHRVRHHLQRLGNGT